MCDFLPSFTSFYPISFTSFLFVTNFLALSHSYMVWSKRFEKDLLKTVQEYTYSSSFDNFLFQYDIHCVTNHCKLLCNLGIIKEEDYIRISQFLDNYKSLPININDQEDIHLFVETLIIKHLGTIGNTIRTARSRNDLTNTDLKLWFQENIRSLGYKILHFLKFLLYKSLDNFNVPFPCFTHSQIAQPSTFGHYLLAYYEMLKRNLRKITFLRLLHNTCPLGSCASVGTRFQINRNVLSHLLHFSKACNNSLDGVSDRDYIIDYLFVCSNTMMHLSRLSEDIIIYCSTPVGLLDLSDSICTGSSLMPQKKNPDLFELIRSNACMTHGFLNTFINIINKQSTTYNKDMQNDKVLSISCCTLVTNTMSVITRSINEIFVNPRQSNFLISYHYSLATDLAEALTMHGIAYKRSHNIVSDIVRFLSSNKIPLIKLNIQTLSKINVMYSFIFKHLDLPTYIDTKSSIYSKNNLGNTSPIRVMYQIYYAIRYLQCYLT